jgi:rhamnogalacturonan endolyase
VPNITDGFDRTFGPQYYYFNTGSEYVWKFSLISFRLISFYERRPYKLFSITNLRTDAEALADPSWNSAFYDSIAQYVTGYIPTTGRGSFKVNCSCTLPLFFPPQTRG